MSDHPLFKEAARQILSGELTLDCDPHWRDRFRLSHLRTVRYGSPYKPHWRGTTAEDSWWEYLQAERRLTP